MISRTIFLMNSILKKIDDRINVAGTSIVYREYEYGFFPFQPDEFFILYLKRLYCFNSLDSWYQ